jgi:aspartate ammonia-lyase
VKYRIERDDLGEKQVPAEAYYGIQSLRAKENFAITKRGLNRQMIKALAVVKKSAAKANADAGLISTEIAKKIMLASDEILNGRLHGQFITDLIQGGAGTSMNMNVNEVIANRANEMLGGERGTYDFVHPLNHVNLCQSTNDVVPTAGKLATIRLTKKLLVELKKLQNSFYIKSVEFEHVLKMGRTHLQDTAPIKFGQIFASYEDLIIRDIKRIELALGSLYEVNIGGSVIGTSLNVHPTYFKKVIIHLAKYSGEDVYQSKNLVDNSRHLDGFSFLSSALKTLAINLSKISNDIRLMSSGPESGIGEINIPAVQPGSSFSPGKVTPVIPELVNQISFYVIGLDMTITNAIEAGDLELNPFIPLILASIFEAIDILRRSARTLREKTIDEISVNLDYCYKVVSNSSVLAVALTPYIGHEKVYMLVRESLETKKSIKDLVLEKKLLPNHDINNILNIENMTQLNTHIEDSTKAKKIKK